MVDGNRLEHLHHLWMRLPQHARPVNFNDHITWHKRKWKTEWQKGILAPIFNLDITALHFLAKLCFLCQTSLPWNVPFPFAAAVFPFWQPSILLLFPFISFIPALLCCAVLSSHSNCRAETVVDSCHIILSKRSHPNTQFNTHSLRHDSHSDQAACLYTRQQSCFYYRIEPVGHCQVKWEPLR